MKIFLLGCFLISLGGCGVRGAPQPPLTPVELGRGQPTYKRATRELAFPHVPEVVSDPSPSEAQRKDKKSP